MLFWFFMLAMALLIPLLMIGCSFLLRQPPGGVFGPAFDKRKSHIHSGVFFGYRTPMSVKSAETWAFAHAHCAMVWRRVGLALLPLSVFAMLPSLAFMDSADVAGWWGFWLIMAQTAVLLASIIPTELALRRVFDKNGNRKG